MRPSRERVIVELENLDQAEKVEETIRTGYCDLIAENLIAWIAAEEDLTESYTKLSEKYKEKREVSDGLRELADESGNITGIVRTILKSIEDMQKIMDKRRTILQLLSQKNGSP